MPSLFGNNAFEDYTKLFMVDWIICGIIYVGKKINLLIIKK